METKMNEVNVEELEAVSGGKARLGGSYRRLPDRPDCQVYQVKKGETLGRIARRFNTTVTKIMAVNETIENANVITAGFYIYIPVV